MRGSGIGIGYRGSLWLGIKIGLSVVQITKMLLKIYRGRTETAFSEGICNILM